MASQVASRNDPISEEYLEEESSEEQEVFYGSSFLRFRSHATRAHFFIIAEACINRQWSSKVSDEDDTVVELTVEMKPPNLAIIDPLFPNHRVDFGFEEDESEIYTFHLDAGNKISRKPPTTSTSPNEETPIWYGFLYDFADPLTETKARNVDFSNVLITGLNNNNKRTRDETDSNKK